jgi:hypothetical protein
MDGGLEAEDNLAHEFHEGREEQLTGILLFSSAFKQLVKVFGV